MKKKGTVLKTILKFLFVYYIIFGYLQDLFIGMNQYSSELSFLFVCFNNFQVNPPSHVHSQSSAPTVTAVLMVIVIGSIIAGVAYYFLKHKNDPFRFQYFKASVFTLILCHAKCSKVCIFCKEYVKVKLGTTYCISS